jgi:hypothetical protein
MAQRYNYAGTALMDKRRPQTFENKPFFHVQEQVFDN